jgi:hypothetical protein
MRLGPSGVTTAGNPKEGRTSPAGVNVKAASWWLKSKATGHPTERVSTGARESMPKPVFYDNDENEEGSQSVMRKRSDF